MYVWGAFCPPPPRRWAIRAQRALRPGMPRVLPGRARKCSRVRDRYRRRLLYYRYNYSCFLQLSVIVFFCRCLCGECKVMPTARENLCCRKPGSYVLSKMAPTIRCITDAGVIRNSCFVEDVLRGEAVIYEITFPLPDQVETKTWRFLAYRRFVQLIYNETRHRQRHVLPACFVSTVRRLWPSEDGTYVGFQDWCIPSWLGHDLLIAHTKYGSAHWYFM